MSWVAAAIGGAGLLGAAGSVFGANKQSKAAKEAARLQYAQYAQTRGDLEPWMYSGRMALKELRNRTLGPNADLTQNFGMEQFQEDPGYQFRLEQGMNAINKGAAARGNFYAPQTLQDLGKYQQGMASTEFQNAYNRYTSDQQRDYNFLSGLSGSGQNAAAGLGGFGANAASQAGQYGTDAAAAQAGGWMGAANALGGAGIGLANYGQYLSTLQNPSYGSTSLQAIGQNGAGWY